MSDKQTTAVVLLVILSFVFYLYHTQKLTPIVATITGGNPQQLGSMFNTSTDAAYITTQAQSANVSYANFANGQDTGYTLNSIFAVNGNTVQYTKPSSNGSGGNTASDLSTTMQLMGLFA